MNKQIIETIQHINQGQERRNAYSSLDGYFYQFELTLYHILLDGSEQEPFDGQYASGESLGQCKAETIEDYIKIIEHEDRKLIRIGQIKHHDAYSEPAKYRESVLFLYFNFLKFSQLDNEVDYKASIFYYSTNDLTKTIATVLDEAMEENAQKYVAVDKKTLAIYLRILDLGTDSTEKRASFNNCTSFIKTDNRNVLKVNAINKIRETISHPRLDYEILFNTAVAKIISSGRNGEYLTKQAIIEYLSDNSEFVNKEAYIELINSAIYYLIYHRFLKALVFNLQFAPLPNSDKDSILDKYRQIAQNIFNFITTNFTIPEHYVSFLKTVIPKEENFNFEENIQYGYEVFLRGIDCIFTFIIKLAKIAYSYWVTTGEKPNVIDWFKINQIKWLFKYPIEERDNGIIVGNLNNLMELDSSIAEIASRYLEDPNRPNVWYYMSNRNNGQCRNYSEHFAYRVDISKIEEEFSTLNVNNDIFFLECMTCLCLEDYHCQDVDKVSNIFKLGCCNEIK